MEEKLGHLDEVVDIPKVVEKNITVQKSIKKPRVYLSWLNYQCNLRLKWKIEQKEETVEFPIDDTRHNIKRDKLATKFEQMGYRVKHEPWLSFEFDEFILSHRIDMYIEKEPDLKVFLEVKSQDKEVYKNQFLGSMLLIALNKREAAYWIYVYKDKKITPKTLSDPDKFRKNLENKIGKLMHDKIDPYPDKHCFSCGYLHCAKNPNHEQLDEMINFQILQEISGRLKKYKLYLLIYQITSALSNVLTLYSLSI